MSDVTFLRSALVGALISFLVACGGSSAGVGGNSDGGADGGADGGVATCHPSWAEVCNGVDDDCDGRVDEDFDLDNDTYTTCGDPVDCDDTNASAFPGGTEVLDQADNDCDGKVDNKVDGNDYDQDGTPYPQDCNDEEALVGPGAVEVGGDGVDNNCDGNTDEAPAPCETTGTSATDFAKAMGICDGLLSASFPIGNTGSRAVRTKFGNQYLPKQGQRLVHLSTGRAVDNLESSSYNPQTGTEFSGTATAHPLWSKPACGNFDPVTQVYDHTELRMSIKVPQNANSFSYDFAFFSAEFPEYVGTEYNDRFIALLTSSAIDKTKLAAGSCVANSSPAACNVSFDQNGQPLTINNGFFTVCSGSGGGQNGCPVRTCTDSDAALAQTGYDKTDWLNGTNVGGATKWLHTVAPVTPGETITLRFIVLDENDAIYDSAVLIDNFKWDAKAVTAPTTEPVIN